MRALQYITLILATTTLFACGGVQNKPTKAVQSEQTVLHDNMACDGPKCGLSLDSLKGDVNRNRIDVYMKYNKPFGKYEVTMLWQPFESQRCETGLAIINFRDTITHRSFQYTNTEKYNNYYTDKITFAEGFDGYKDGDILYLDAIVPGDNPYPMSPLNYYEPFMFYDADFDGEDELLVSDWGQGQQGNMYSVYDITANGLVEKVQPPFDRIDNCSMFHPAARQIETFTHGGIFSEETLFYKITEDGNIYEASIESVFRSPVYRNNCKDEYWFEFTKRESGQDTVIPHIALKITHNNVEVFNENISWSGEFSFNCNDFFPTAEDGVVRISEVALNFIDIDFDGVDEIITDLTPFAGSQRNLPGLGSIYRLNDSKYTDATDEFTLRCEVFNEIEPYFFIVDYRNKSIIHCNDGGYMSGGWEVYKYHNGSYAYNRYVHFDRDIESEMVDITINYADNTPQKSMRVSSDDFEKRGYNF